MQLVTAHKGNALEDEFEPVIARRLKGGEIGVVCGIGEIEIPLQSGEIKRSSFHVLTKQPGDYDKWEIDDGAIVPVSADDEELLYLRHVLDISPTQDALLCEYVLSKTTDNFEIIQRYYYLERAFSRNRKFTPFPNGVTPLKFIGDNIFNAKIDDEGNNFFNLPLSIAGVSIQFSDGKFEIFLPSKKELQHETFYDVLSDSSFGPWVRRISNGAQGGYSITRQLCNFATPKTLVEATHVVATTKQGVVVGDKYLTPQEYNSPLPNTLFGPAIWGRESVTPQPILPAASDPHTELRIIGAFDHNSTHYVAATGLDSNYESRTGRVVRLSRDLRDPEQEEILPLSEYCATGSYKEKIPTDVSDGLIVARTSDGVELLMPK